MLTAWRSRNPGRALVGVAWFEFCVHICWLVLTGVYRLRVWRAAPVPRGRTLLIVSNHQSNLDPVLVGVALMPRHTTFIAKSSLFFPGMRALIASLNAISLKQDEPDTAAIRATLTRLSQGAMVLVFPEGSRTRDGAMRRFKRGTWLLLSRAKCGVLPVAIEGPFDAYPRGSGFPKIFGQRLGAQVGQVIEPETLLAMGEEAGLAHLQQTIESMRAQLAERLRCAGATISSKPFVDAQAD